MIEVPPKIWTPKIVNQFKMPSYDDIDDGIFQFQSFGNCVYRTEKCWQDGDRTDILCFDATTDLQELDKDLRIGNVASDSDSYKNKNIIKKFGIVFVSEGATIPSWVTNLELTQASTPLFAAASRHMDFTSGI